MDGRQTVKRKVRALRSYISVGGKANANTFRFNIICIY